MERVFHLTARSKDLALAALVAFHVSTAHAAPHAEELYLEGKAASDRGDYREAIALYRESYQLSRLPLLVFNIAQAYRLSGDCPRALAQYRNFVRLDDGSNPGEYADAKQFIAELRCKQTPDESRDEQRPSGTSTLKTGGLVTGGVGIGLLIGGLVLGHRASTTLEEVDTLCNSVGCDWSVEGNRYAAAQRNKTIAVALDITGAIAIVAGAAMYLVGRRPTSHVTVTATSDGGAIEWSGRW